MKRHHYISVISKTVPGFIAGLSLFVTSCSPNNRYAVYQYDNGDDYFSEGLQRIVDKYGKIGFRIALRPSSNNMLHFFKGYAKVMISTP